jgi:hypothetical protein
MMKLNLVTLSLLLLSSCVSPKQDDWVFPVEVDPISDMEKTQRSARLLGKLLGTISERDYYRGERDYYRDRD